MSTMPIENQQKSLALGVACGRSVRLWARRHDVDFTTAYEWSIQNEFRDLVELARLRVADCMVGRLVRGARSAIDQLVRLCTKADSDATRLSASRALLTYWMKVNEHFYIVGSIRQLKERVNHLERLKKSGEWFPPTPYKEITRKK
jgi:hypothetical protein